MQAGQESSSRLSGLTVCLTTVFHMQDSLIRGSSNAPLRLRVWILRASRPSESGHVRPRQDTSGRDWADRPADNWTWSSPAVCACAWQRGPFLGGTSRDRTDMRWFATQKPTPRLSAVSSSHFFSLLWIQTGCSLELRDLQQLCLRLPRAKGWLATDCGVCAGMRLESVT